MGDLAAILPSYFGAAGERAVKVRGFYLIEAGKIQKTDCKPREILARFNLLNRLDEVGFSYTDRIIPTTSGEPFIALGRDIFVMTRRVPGREPDFESASDMTLIMEAIAKFHAAARGIKEMPAAPPLSEIYAKQIAATSAAIKQVHRRPRLSDFDVLVLKHAPEAFIAAESAQNFLADTDYKALYDDAISGGHVCHNVLKEESLSVADDGCYITRFEEASIDLQLSDLATFLRRYARKSSRKISATQLLEIYEKYLPLPVSAKKILFAELSFPWQFFRLVSQCYQKKRAFVPAAITSRMAEILEERGVYEGYIAGLK
ncbi:MAG: hypothetical protein FWF77_07590 [Defluviitaleaceae bacterium]|nr:hypothetical protein [Defluviitaleaceae bacterium]